MKLFILGDLVRGRINLFEGKRIRFNIDLYK